MDFNGQQHRSTFNQQQTARMSAAPGPVSPPPAAKLPSKKDGGWSRAKDDLLTLGGRIGTNVLLFVVALLIAAVAWLTYSATPTSQNHYLDNSKLQAVFLKKGDAYDVYFGNIQTLNKDYLVLTNVYYLQQSNTTNASSSSKQNVSLIKLGCELHRPYDRMVINADEVAYWENLSPDGQVGKAVAQFQKENPNGQKCTDTPTTGNSLQNQTAPTSSTSR